MTAPLLELADSYNLPMRTAFEPSTALSSPASSPFLPGFARPVAKLQRWQIPLAKAAQVRGSAPIAHFGVKNGVSQGEWTMAFVEHFAAGPWLLNRHLGRALCPLMSGCCLSMGGSGTVCSMAKGCVAFWGGVWVFET